VRGAWVGALAAAAFLAATGAPARSAPASIEIQASSAGFTPAQLDLRRGEQVHLVLTSADREHCFAVDEMRIEKRIVPGRPTSVELTPERTGRFPFYCCLESGQSARVERGEIVVSE